MEYELKSRDKDQKMLGFWKNKNSMREWGNGINKLTRRLSVDLFRFILIKIRNRFNLEWEIVILWKREELLLAVHGSLCLFHRFHAPFIRIRPGVGSDSDIFLFNIYFSTLI